MLPANTGWFDWILLDVMQGNKEESSCFSLLPVAFHVFLHYDQQVKQGVSTSLGGSRLSIEKTWISLPRRPPLKQWAIIEIAPSGRVVEVVSQSTRKKDNTIKRQSYQSLPSLEEYVLIEQDFVDIEVCRRSKHWWPEHYYLGDTVHFASIDLTLSVEDIYARVMNDDMQAYRKNATGTTNKTRTGWQSMFLEIFCLSSQKLSSLYNII